jgi:chemotaxis protein methyltransferase CheR
MREHFGISLGPGKDKLVAARLNKKIRQLRFSSFRQYLNHVLHDGTGVALQEMADALTTNYTGFFREPDHFRFVRELASDRAHFKNTFRVWSAACSTGEEPYSIVMSLMDELGPSSQGRFQVLASDISTRALDFAQKAIYRNEQLAALPLDVIRRYFDKGDGPSAGFYRVKRGISALVEFRPINLVADSYPAGSFRVIFCRNVMIYFDRSTQAAVVQRLANCLEPGGYLFTGHSESLTGVSGELEYVQPATYRKCASPASLKKTLHAR